MKRLLSLLVVNFMSFYILDLLFSNISFNNWQAIVAIGLIFTIVNAVIKPMLKVLSLPITILTLGLFSLVVNAIVLQIAFRLTSGAYIAGFGTAFWASIVLAIVNSVISNLVKD